MFGKLFEKKAAPAEAREDRVWKTAAACRNGICAEALRSVAAGRKVIIVCVTNAAFEALDTILAAQNPVRCRDMFGREALCAALAQHSAGTLALALSGCLPAEIPATLQAVDILVCGRHATRTADAAITRFADQLGPRAVIAFYLSLEDAVLKPLMTTGLPLLERLGLKDDEAWSHTMLTRAIRNIQPA